MAFKLSLVADVREWLRGTKDVEQSLDDLADSLDDLAKETKQDADKAADALEREFSDAFDKVKTESKQTSRKMGDDFKQGTREAGEGLGEFKDEANSTAREAAASFSGEFDDVADAIQETLANALAGFGPIGAAAGVAAAIGIGLLIGNLQDAAEKAEESKDRVLDLADAIADAGGDPSAIRWAEQLRDTMKQIVDTKEWYEFWQNSPVDKLSDWSAKARQFGVSMSDVMRSQAGDAEALARVNDALNRTVDEQTEKFRLSTDINGDQDQSYRQAAEGAARFRDEVGKGAQEVGDAAKWQKEYADATKDFSNAQAEAAEAAKTFSDSLTDNLSVADEGLDRFVKKGKLKINEWTRELQERAGQNARIKDFMVDVETKLSPEARENFAKLPTETQDQIAQAFDEGTAKQRKQIIKNLEAEAKVEKVNVDLSGAQTSVNSKPITVPTNVDTSGAIRGAQSAAAAAQKAVSAEASHVELKTKVNDQGALKGAQKAADDAQRIANQERNKIEYKTKVNDDALQGEVNRAAARINPPTIWVNVKAKKDTP